MTELIFLGNFTCIACIESVFYTELCLAARRKD